MWFSFDFRLSGRSAVWLARFVRDEEVGGSNPLAPTSRQKARRNAGFFVIGKQKPVLFVADELKRKTR